MAYSTLPSALLQSILFSHSDFSSSLFREPTERELEFISYLQTAHKLLNPDQTIQLIHYHSVGRIGYELLSIFGILMMKLFYHQRTMKDTLLLLEEHMNLQDILGLKQVPSEASMSRLSRKVEQIVPIKTIHTRLIHTYRQGMTGRVVGHLSIDSTTIEAREKPYRKKKEAQEKPEAPPRKRGRKAKGSPEEKEYLERIVKEEEARRHYLKESPEKSISALEKRCSLTAKQNSKGKRQWFIGYKAHIAADDFGVPISFAVTGACVHDSKVAVPLLKMAKEKTEFFYILLDKGYISPAVNDYADMIERKVIIDRKGYKGVSPIPLEPAYAERYKARTTVERTNSELKDGFLPDKIYKRGAQARYEIELALFLTAMKKVSRILRQKNQAESA